MGGTAVSTGLGQATWTAAWSARTPSGTVRTHTVPVSRDALVGVGVIIAARAAWEPCGSHPWQAQNSSLA